MSPPLSLTYPVDIYAVGFYYHVAIAIVKKEAAVDILESVSHTPGMKKFLSVILLLAAAASARGQEPAPSTVPLTLPDGKTLQVEVARTQEKRALGLMFRTALAEDRGMLFVFDRPGLYRFWMKNTLIPLDMVWLDDRKRIIYIEYQVPPCKVDPCPVYGPTADSLYVLEVISGVASREKLRVGQTLTF